jgi:hypothetical protein
VLGAAHDSDGSAQRARRSVLGAACSAQPARWSTQPLLSTTAGPGPSGAAAAREGEQAEAEAHAAAHRAIFDIALGAALRLPPPRALPPAQPPQQQQPGSAGGGFDCVLLADRLAALSEAAAAAGVHCSRSRCAAFASAPSRS